MLSLPACRELGPVLRNRGVDVESVRLGQLVRADRGGALRGGEDADDRVLLPPPLRGHVGEATPEVHDLLTAVVGAERCAHLQPVGEVLLEPVPDTFESRRGPAVDRHGCLPISRRAWCAPRAHAQRGARRNATSAGGVARPIGQTMVSRRRGRPAVDPAGCGEGADDGAGRAVQRHDLALKRAGENEIAEHGCGAEGIAVDRGVPTDLPGRGVHRDHLAGHHAELRAAEVVLLRRRVHGWRVDDRGVHDAVGDGRRSEDAAEQAGEHGRRLGQLGEVVVAVLADGGVGHELAGARFECEHAAELAGSDHQVGVAPRESLARSRCARGRDRRGRAGWPGGTTRACRCGRAARRRSRCRGWGRGGSIHWGTPGCPGTVPGSRCPSRRGRAPRRSTAGTTRHLPS